MAVVFFSYSHKDEALRDRLEQALIMLQREGLIEAFHDRRIPPGDLLDPAIDAELERADIILFLLSPDFLSSRYCYDLEMARALERAESGAAKVIPIVLRPCEWDRSPLGKYLALPTDARAVTKHPDLDDAFLDISKGLRAALAARPGVRKSATNAGRVEPGLASGAAFGPGPRSSNLHVPKRFSDIDKDRFQHEAFDYIALYVENSLAELQARNPGVEGIFRRIAADEFTAQIYRDGRKLGFCRVYTGGDTLGGGIAYAGNESMARGSVNESLSVEADGNGMSLKALGMASHGQQKQQLTLEGAAEYYWSMLIEPLRR